MSVQCKVCSAVGADSRRKWYTVHAIHIESREEAQNAPNPITNYALFHDGEYITNEQMNDKKFLKLVNGYHGIRNGGE